MEHETCVYLSTFTKLVQIKSIDKCTDAPDISKVYSILLYRRNGGAFYLTSKLITRLLRRWPSFESRLEISPSSLRTSRTVIASIADAVAPQEINPLVAMEAKEVELDDNGESPSKVPRDYYKGIFTVAFNLSRYWEYRSIDPSLSV